MDESAAFYIIWLLHTITESLPISSSTHIRLINIFFNKKSLFNQTFEYALHLSTLIVLVAFLVSGSWVLINKEILTLPYFLQTCIYVFVADILTILVYYLFKIFKISIEMFTGLSISAVALLLSYFFAHGDSVQITLSRAMLIGMVQGIALLPGISRLAITICTGAFLKLEPLEIVMFSCAIQLPLVIAALVCAFRNNNRMFEIFKLNFFKLSILFIALCISYFLLWLTVYALQNNYLWIFGIYILVILYAFNVKLLNKFSCNFR